ncbi:hypothetical protein SSX86_004620 [Deinandra increscens subsp. villosa]|uniref:C2H2-type domain-containing protein n=1 Tax=Deinandra increscens subsp. villosa TaxID=3103831 RepID=A0AAP0H985_9ASTR
MNDIEMKKPCESVSHPGSKTILSDDYGGDYKCKTCNKRFDTFQALGGHQRMHKKVKFGDNNDAFLSNLDVVVHKSSGLHQCKTCMKGFETGQALGGHMRRHRLEKTLILMEQERLWRQQVVAEEVGDLVLAAAELQRLKAEEDKRHEAKSELVLAAKEWRLSV